MKTPKFKSTFALLDVMAGRKALAKHVAGGRKVRVIVEMDINYAWGNDDGESQEFACSVKSVKVKP